MSIADDIRTGSGSGNEQLARTKSGIKSHDHKEMADKQNGVTAILIYSLSELILTVGIAKSMRFVNEIKAAASLSTAQRCSGSSSSSSSSSSGSGRYNGSDQNALSSSSRGLDDSTAADTSIVQRAEEAATLISILALVHTSLHTGHTLSRLLPQPQSSCLTFSSTGSPFNASVIVKPNDGSLSARTFKTDLLIIMIISLHSLSCCLA